jgi:hypothetical protein
MRPLIQSICTLSGIVILSGCASAPPVAHSPASSPALDMAPQPADDTGNLTAAETYLAALEPSELATTARQLDSTLLLMPAVMPTPAGDGEDRSGTSYLTAKGGVFYPSESDLNDGWIANLAYGRYFTRFFSLELEGGYMAPDPDVSSVDLYAVPLMLNGRVNLPLWILEAYGGAGLGGTYYNIDASSSHSDGWLWTGSLFLGANLVLLDRLTGGLELKYYLTDEIRNTHDSLGGLAVMLTLGLRF